MSDRRMTDEELAREARRWDARETTPGNWEDSPEAVPRTGESVAISIRIPKDMLSILKEFAKRKGVGYQVLMKKWLDDRIREERVVIREKQQTIHVERPHIIRRAASFDQGKNVKLWSSGDVE